VQTSLVAPRGETERKRKEGGGIGIIVVVEARGMTREPPKKASSSPLILSLPLEEVIPLVPVIGAGIRALVSGLSAAIKGRWRFHVGRGSNPARSFGFRILSI